MGVAASGTVADVVVAIMTEGNIHNASLGEVLYIRKVVLQGQPILYAEHDALSTLALVAVKISRSTGDAEILAVLAHYLFYLVEDEVGILRRSINLESHLATEALAYLRLRQVSHHGCGILVSIGHLVQIHENARVTMVELHTLREEHRSVAMGIERKDSLVQLLGSIEIASLVHQPLENLQALLAKPLWMPLHTEYLLVLVALYRLDDAIGGFGNDAHVLARLAHSLMVERVDEDFLLIVYII